MAQTPQHFVIQAHVNNLLLEATDVQLLLHGIVPHEPE